MDEFSYCPYCGNSLIDNREKNKRDYGLLGKNDAIEEEMTKVTGLSNFGLTDKMITSMFNMVMKNLNQQMREDLEGAEITPLPNGIKIQIGQQPKKKQVAQKMVKRVITEEQMQRISKLPRKEAKSSMRRLGDKLVYELATPGVNSPSDVFVSRLEEGYEIKALGDKRMYVNSLQINLPIQRVSLDNNKVLVEFKTEE
jgi:hypothetical protein